MVSFSVSVGLVGESRRESDQAVTPINRRKTSPAAVPRTAARCLRRNFRARYTLPGGRGQHGPVLQVILDIGGEVRRPTRSAARVPSPVPST